MQNRLDLQAECRLDAKPVLNRFKELGMIVSKQRTTAPWARLRTATVLMCMAGAKVHGQNIGVDVTPGHVRHTIAPTKALGAGIDRLPYGAADKLFDEATIKQVLSAGWQTLTYRQNTELHTEAWHWNPQGTWSDPTGKGYFVGNAKPGTDMIR